MIAISAGHYPAQPGARFNGVDEWHEATLWASRIAQLLGEISVYVPTGTLRDKVEYINNHRGVLIACEVHFNSAPIGVNGKGSETLYFPGSNRGRLLAQHIQERLGAIFVPNRGAKEGWYRMNRENGPDFFLAKTRVPSVIVEPQFIQELADIREKRDMGCHIIAESLASFLSGGLADARTG